MQNKSRYPIWLAGLLLVPGLALPQEKEKTTARDMFHSAAGLVVPVKATDKPARVSRPKPVQTAPVAKPAEQAKSPAPEPTSGYVAASLPSGQPAGPLGLRYSILKEIGEGRTAEVNPDNVFRSGDRIRLAVQANDTASLYIIQRGSSGNWGVLFPSPEINGGDNVVQRGRQYEIPAGHWFAFDEQPGEEKLFIVLCRRPEPNLEKMIYAIRQDQKEAPAQEPKRAKVLLAQDTRPIDDALVTRIRSQVYARDLIFEKVDEKTPGERKEKAVYVVNRTGSVDSRIVADLTLSHR